VAGRFAVDVLHLGARLVPGGALLRGEERFEEVLAFVLDEGVELRLE
jgi:hypothetical protein